MGEWNATVDHIMTYLVSPDGMWKARLFAVLTSILYVPASIILLERHSG